MQLGMEEGYIHNIFYQKNKFKKNRKTVIFVHGLSGSSSAWIPYIELFKNKYNILAIDLRGHGKSFKYKKYESYSIDNFSKDLFNLVKYHKIKKFILVCHSFGVFIGLDFLNKHKDMVERAVLLSPATTPPDGIASRILRKILHASSLLNLIPLKKDIGKHIDYSKYPNTKDWNIRRMIADVGNTGLKIYLWATKQSYDFNADSYLKEINIPTLLIHGKKDSIFPFFNSVVMHKKIKNSKLLLMDDIDHIIVLNKFQEISKLIDNFISI